MSYPTKYIMNKDEQSYIRRFWSKVDKTGGCWIFNGSPSQRYGSFLFKDKEQSAHGFSYKLANGIPLDKKLELCVLHSCDVPKCVNPAHLREGTQAENIADMIAKNRDKLFKSGHQGGKQFIKGQIPVKPFPKGHLPPTAQITREIAAEIRETLKTNTCRQTAIIHNTTLDIVKNISSGKTWKIKK